MLCNLWFKYIAGASKPAIQAVRKISRAEVRYEVNEKYAWYMLISFKAHELKYPYKFYAFKWAWMYAFHSVMCSWIFKAYLSACPWKLGILQKGMSCDGNFIQFKLMGGKIQCRRLLGYNFPVGYCQAGILWIKYIARELKPAIPAARKVSFWVGIFWEGSSRGNPARKPSK